MAHLTDAESAEVVRSLEGWALVDRGIEKEFTFEGFPEAVDFVSRLVHRCRGCPTTIRTSRSTTVASGCAGRRTVKAA